MSSSFFLASINNRFISSLNYCLIHLCLPSIINRPYLNGISAVSRIFSIFLSQWRTDDKPIIKFYYSRPYRYHLSPSTISFSASAVCVNWYTLPTSITGLGFISTISLACIASFEHSPVDREVPIRTTKGNSLSLISYP